MELVGIPEKLYTLLGITKKSELLKYCRRITISEDELVSLTLTCHQFGYIYSPKFKDYIPDGRRLTDIDIANLKAGKTRKFGNKVHSIFEERKHYMVHLFEKGEEWHCFFSTYQDMKPDQSHFGGRPHLHFVNYLWSSHAKLQVWEAFDQRTHDVQKSVHIKMDVKDFGDIGI